MEGELLKFDTSNIDMVNPPSLAPNFLLYTSLYVCVCVCVRGGGEEQQGV